MPSPTSDTPTILTGPLRAPRQMLAEQSYAGHTSGWVAGRHGGVALR